MLNTWYVFHVSSCALSVYNLRSHIWIFGLCVFSLIIRCYWAHDELNLLSNQHILIITNTWIHASTNLLGNEYVWLLFMAQFTKKIIYAQPTWNLSITEFISCCLVIIPSFKGMHHTQKPTKGVQLPYSQRGQDRERFQSHHPSSHTSSLEHLDLHGHGIKMNQKLFLHRQSM